MNGIEKQVVFYRAYLIDDRSLAPLTTALATIVGLWLIVYLVSAIGGAEANKEMAQGRGACVLPRVPIFVTVTAAQTRRGAEQWPSSQYNQAISADCKRFIMSK
jgi:hypothetical protein